MFLLWILPFIISVVPEGIGQRYANFYFENFFIDIDSYLDAGLLNDKSLWTF